jgi:hypothetical protein
MRQKMIQKERKATIDGIEDFPLKSLGLKSNPIEKSDGHVIIPVELLPYLKIHKQTAMTRKNRLKIEHKYLSNLKRSKSPKKGGRT